MSNFFHILKTVLCMPSTIEELLSLLPSKIEYDTEGESAHLTIFKREDYYVVSYEYFEGFDLSGRIIIGTLYETKDESLLNALAKMYARLKQEGRI